eukprot:CAMPEP_0119067430 /NCGR_PEP_ID=MMETSP1178-20130426/9788_1 /TAXON_ID=33656 /ORGANISM="unid sp, Strain CCMP2000" /LENGTH=146 /DNA_ID=CAMNT_0007049083 /DNA_START=57 /DNA_END=497 /DNA_ORIENTATION=+
MPRTLADVLMFMLIFIQSSTALVLTGVRAPTIRGRSGLVQGRLSEEEGGVCIKLDLDDEQMCEKAFEQPKDGQLPSELEDNPMSGSWLFCKEPPNDPSVTCFLAEDVEWLDGKAPDGAPWLCSDSPVMRESPHDGIPVQQAQEDSY